MAQTAEILLEGGFVPAGPRRGEFKTARERRLNQIRKQLNSEFNKYSEIRGLTSRLTNEMLTYHSEISRLHVPTLVGALVIMSRIRALPQRQGTSNDINLFPAVKKDDIIQNIIDPELKPEVQGRASIKHQVDLLRYLSLIFLSSPTLF